MGEHRSFFKEPRELAPGDEKRLWAHVRDLPCARCWREGRTQVSHSNSLIDGKGRGLKSYPWRVAALCVECHAMIDQGKDMKKAERQEAWESAHRWTMGELFLAALGEADMSGWHDQRFEASASKHRQQCLTCGRGMWFPASKAGMYTTCGGECAKALRAKTSAEVAAARPVKPARMNAAIGPMRPCFHCGGEIQLHRVPDLGRKFCSIACVRESSAALLAARTRSCAHCAKPFIVKKSQIDSGHGTFCSHRCTFDSGVTGHLVTPTNIALAHANRRVSVAINGPKHKHGPEHCSWKGGPEASKARRRPKEREATRRYRAANPDKVREFARSRKGRKLGKLPYGTVPRLYRLQKGKCPICRRGLGKNYHVDHVKPLAKGGAHTVDNIQLLCPPCNVRKSAKDPIDYMQERGFLL